MIQQNKIREVRDRASIVEVISDYVTLKKAGRNHIGICPFHAENTPSFTVSEEKGIFHCFGCQLGGSVFDFLMRHDQLSFPEAVERVAKRYGLVVERIARADGVRQAGVKEGLYRVNEIAAANYHRILLDHHEGKQALAYLKGRGVDEAMVRRFMLGYAPQRSSGLLDLLHREKGSIEAALQLGLIGRRDPQGLHEKFFSRVIFPIIDAAGKVVGFGGRVLNNGLPKYLNSSDTPLFRKGSTLYGLYQAREGIRKADRVVIVEGYLDALALSQFDLPYVVATLGTALTFDHVRLLSRYTKNIIALFDGDDAGRKAAARSFEIFAEGGILAQAAFLPKGEDPDTFVRRRGRAALEAVLAEAVPLADYYFSWLEERHGKSMEGKSQTAGEISRLLLKIHNPFEIDLLVRRAIDRLGIREETLRRAPPRPGLRPSTRASEIAAPAGPSSREDVAQRSLISLMLSFRAVISLVVGDAEWRLWLEPKWQELVDVISAEWREQGQVDLFRVSQKLSSARASEISALALEGENISQAECDKIAADCIAHLRRRYLRNLEQKLRTAIRAAEEQKDEKAKRERILEWQDVVRKERQLKHSSSAPKIPFP